MTKKKREFALQYKQLWQEGWSLEEAFDNVLRIMLKDKTRAELARETGLHPVTLGKWAKRRGITPKRKKTRLLLRAEKIMSNPDLMVMIRSLDKPIWGQLRFERIRR